MNPRAQGEVVFVGAGPGASDLITLRGARVIAEADIVIWASSLVDEGIVAGARPDALVIDSASASLEDITPLYQRAHDEGLLVARVHTEGRIDTTEHTDTGTKITARVPVPLAASLREFSNW